MSLDLVIPAHEKDINTLNICIDYARKNIIDLNNIYVVSRNKLTDNAIWISEKSFPFKLEDVAKKIGKHRKTCWYYAGLIQTTSALLIPNLKKYVLIMDSDTIVVKPVKFLENDVSLFNISPGDGLACYYEHAFKMVPSLKRQHQWSGVCHHILINREIMKDLFKRVEDIHKKPFWEAYIDVTLEPYSSLRERTINDVSGKHANGQGRLTSYELYFTFALQYHPDKVKIRKLNSIMAYKGWVGLPGYELGHPSRTNLHGNHIQIIPIAEESNFNFKNIDESLRYISKRCYQKGYDMVTFQNHTRIGSSGNSKINVEYINRICK